MAPSRPAPPRGRRARAAAPPTIPRVPLRRRPRHRSSRTPRDEEMAEEAARPLVERPPGGRRPKRGELAAVEARDDARHRVMSGHVVAADEPEEMRPPERRARAARRAGDEHVRAPPHAPGHPPERARL